MLAFFSSDKPAAPTLRADRATRKDGDNVVFTCTTKTSGITAYEFKNGANPVANSASTTFTISAAAINSQDDTYTCIAYIHTVASDESADYTAACESVTCRPNLLTGIYTQHFNKRQTTPNFR